VKDPAPAEPPKQEPPPAEPAREEPPAQAPPRREPPQEPSPESAAPAARAATASPARRAPAPPPPTPARLPALIAEDSITARIFLTRMLEQHGLEVEAVDTAAELHRRLATRAWAVVCVDVELPDARGEDLLRGVLAGGAGRVPTVVALVRDEADLAAARGAGISRALRKPFDQSEVVDLLARLGLARGGRT
jgi:CheY-like chemotaxis protein